jgi:hypothetical protein
MKLRHAAVLALVGWYLMIAPRDPPQPALCPYFNLAAPLSQWTGKGWFDNKVDCEGARSLFLRAVLQDCWTARGPNRANGTSSLWSETYLNLSSAYKCVPSDDSYKKLGEPK